MGPHRNLWLTNHKSGLAVEMLHTFREICLGLGEIPGHGKKNA